MTDVLVVCDARGRIEQVNPALTALVGQGEEALIGTSIQALFCAGDHADLLATLDALARERPWPRGANGSHRQRRRPGRAFGQQRAAP
jgi:two-component system sensor histidine kinase HupT/HoxJ